MRESQNGTWFQTPEAYDFFASMPALFTPFAIAIENDANDGNDANDDFKLRGVCVGYVTVEKNPIKQFFTRRAIILGGPAIVDDCSDEEVELLMTSLRSMMTHKMLNDGMMSPIYIETRNFNDYSKWRDAFEKAGFAYQPHLNFHVDCRDQEKMWERLSENRKRQIRKVSATMSLNDAAMQPNEPQASLLNNENDVREWYAILQQLYRTKVKTPLWPVEFFLEAYRQGVGKFLLVKHNNHVIGGSMIVCKGDRLSVKGDWGTVYEWFECGLNVEYKEQYPSVMATWAGMEYANQHGIARYDMMGAGEPNIPYGVRDFKAEFGGNMVEHGRWLCVINHFLYQLGTLWIKLLKKNIQFYIG